MKARWVTLGWISPAPGGKVHFRWYQDGAPSYQLCADFDEACHRARLNCHLDGTLTAIASDVRYQMLFDGGREVTLLGEVDA